MTNDTEPIGILFGKIPFKSIDELNIINTNITDAHRNFYIISALEYAYNSGIFNLYEAEIISNCIRNLTNETTNQL